MGKLHNCRPVLQALSFIILLVLWNVQTLFYSILLLEEIAGDRSPNTKAAAEETDVLLKKSQTKNQTKDNLKIFFLSFN